MATKILGHEESLEEEAEDEEEEEMDVDGEEEDGEMRVHGGGGRGAARCSGSGRISSSTNDVGLTEMSAFRGGVSRKSGLSQREKFFRNLLFFKRRSKVDEEEIGGYAGGGGGGRGGGVSTSGGGRLSGGSLDWFASSGRGRGMSVCSFNGDSARDSRDSFLLKGLMRRESTGGDSLKSTMTLRGCGGGGGDSSTNGLRRDSSMMTSTMTMTTALRRNRLNISRIESHNQ